MSGITVSAVALSDSNRGIYAAKGSLVSSDVVVIEGDDALGIFFN